MAPTSTTERWPAANGLASIEEAVGAFSLLRDFFEGAIIVDAQTRVTWMDARYRELLKLAPEWPLKLDNVAADGSPTVGHNYAILP